VFDAQALARTTEATTVRAGIIGTGQYGTAVITQSSYIETLDVPVAADLEVEAACRAFKRAGYPEEQIAICESRREALSALERGQRVVVPDAEILLALPIDVVVEATGVPEAGARNALEAIRAGKHVAMVNKEADAVVGPILCHLAKRAGLTYSAVDGDQHGLAMGMVYWAEALGLEVLCVGKSRDLELVYDPGKGTLTHRREGRSLTAQERQAFVPCPSDIREAIRARLDVLGPWAQPGGYDLTELTVLANATGLMPDVDTLHCPPLYTREIPEALCPREEGGLLNRRGVVEAVTTIRYPHEPGLGGGEFLVVSCANDYSRWILTSKGLVANRRNTAALIYRPYHLCGVETPLTILAAGRLGLPTGAIDYCPRVDLVAQARIDLRAGEILGNDHSENWQALIRPAQRVESGAPLPLHMASGQVLAADVPAGSIITPDMIHIPHNSVLWALRREQDQHFLN